ncbi:MULTISPECIES: DinB family protein [Bacillus]|uniref:Damage-inducible protein DinB n=2 Tax=Bacillus cereus group TaxID=86661 RepID=A0A2A7D6T7_BACAN|nr:MULTISPECIES: DinB family protein [Bacillus]MCP1163601.1 DinB family protein [Bacillus sp. 1813sda1]OTW72424.1 damage-inducible protein DinB [Bacillus thuringiensis serovar coreanensis]OTX49480.1 damage-inducible protein DinB [Bacillus thuringiensis serovar sooncheon]OTX57342.1 damage-inducible protein DinB [Bacillus thuringiensis serovar guiyangiensis]OTX71813.1 damage-inducible protein DinB [Bacillus thuringiensis serovar roskildiensis]
MKEYMLKQVDYHAWANTQLFNRIKELPNYETIFTEQIQSVFPSIKDTFAHIYVTDQVWLHILHGKSMNEAIQDRESLRTEIENKSFLELEEMFDNMAKQYIDFLITIEDVNAVFVIENPYVGKLETSILELVQHVVNHGTYHRGNITAMIRQLGHSSTMTDFVLYLHMVKKQGE